MAIKQELLDQLEERRKFALSSGCGPEKLEARHAKGLFSARERVADLVDDGSFQEAGMYVDLSLIHI